MAVAHALRAGAEGRAWRWVEECFCAMGAGLSDPGDGVAVSRGVPAGSAKRASCRACVRAERSLAGPRAAARGCAG